MMMDIASLLTHSSDGADLIEAFCSHNSMLTKVARQAGLKCERWTVDDFDLATEEGYDQAEARLRELKPRRIWLSPECGPFSQLQNANQRTEEQVKNLQRKRKEGLKQWHSCMRLAWVQLELGGYFYIEQPQTCSTWQINDTLTNFIVWESSSYCIRDQCFDGLAHPKSGNPMKKSTRIQTNDESFSLNFGQRCVGHEIEHARIEGGRLARSTSFYPKQFCQRAVQLWKTWDNKQTPKSFLKKFRDAKVHEEADCTTECPVCHRYTPACQFECSQFMDGVDDDVDCVFLQSWSS